MAWLVRNQYLVLAVSVLISLSTLALLAFASKGPPPIEILYDAGLEPGTPIRVHVTGAVARPGVYDLKAGDRVTDAVALAGGATEPANLEAVNLARRVRDEEQLVIPTRAARAAAVPTLVPGARLDINTATAEQLDLLPGIGEAYSRRIVDSRHADGPFRSIDDLVTRRVLPQAVMEQLRTLIEVRP